MKKKAETEKDDMLPEYDFTGKKGIRGKYYRAYGQGYSVRIHKEDGTESVRHFAPEEGYVMLDPDIREYFPNSETVNTLLRSLIALIPNKPVKRKVKHGTI